MKKFFELMKTSWEITENQKEYNKYEQLDMSWNAWNK